MLYVCLTAFNTVQPREKQLYRSTPLLEELSQFAAARYRVGVSLEAIANGFNSCLNQGLWPRLVVLHMQRNN